MLNSRIGEASRIFILTLAAGLAVCGSGCTRSETRESCSANCSDSQISASVRKKLFDQASVAHAGISVSTVDGVVYLQGLVNTSVERDAAVAAASEVPGVAHVVNSLEINGSN